MFPISSNNIAVPPTKTTISGPFKATKIWKDLVNHLYENANVKKRRVLMKSHDDCFSGTNAVDTLLNYVQRNSTRFPNTSMVTRENIVRLCQSFIDRGVFESVNVGDDSEKRSKFEDSSSSLYRFTIKDKSDFIRSDISRSSQSLNNDNDVDHLPAKFSALLSAPRTVEPVQRSKAIFSPFGHASNFRYSRTKHNHASESQTSDSDCENRKAVKTPKMKRSNASFVGLVMKRSSSDSNLRKGSTTSSSESDSSSKRRSPGDPFSRGRLRLSQRLSFRKKSLRRSGQSSYHLTHPCVIQNPAAAKDRLTDQEDVSSGETQNSSHKLLKRKGSRENGTSAVADAFCSKVKIMSSQPLHKKLTTQEASHVKRESVRVRLLQILDLPFVETLITSPTFDKKILATSMTDNNQSNRYTDMQYSEVASSYNSNDSWIFSSLSVLQHVPNGYDILRKQARADDDRKKTELYFAIADHYRSQTRPLIDENYNGIALAIINLMTSRPADKIMEAMQLFVHLLADSRLSELRHLCMFLHTVCAQNKVKLVHKGNNQALVIKTFTPAILRMSDSAACENGLDGCKGLVRFLVQHHLRVFMLPASIDMIVQRKIDLLEQGNIDSPSLVADSTFCPLISESEYQNQCVTNTNRQLQELYHVIQSNPEMQMRKKKDLMKKFQRCHPNLFGANNNDAEVEASRTSKVGEKEKSSSHLSRPFLTLTRSKNERKMVSSECYRELSSHKSAMGTGTDNNESSSKRPGNVQSTPRTQLKNSISTRSMRFTAPNSDPLTRRKKKNARGDIYI